MSEQPLEELRRLLEGKTIKKVLLPNGSEAICRFVMEDGSSFRLHATDLGFWIEDTKGSSGYNSLNSLIRDIYHNYNSDYEIIIINIMDESLTFSVTDGLSSSTDDKIFTLKINKLTNGEKRIINHPKGIERLADAICVGDLWKIFFNKNSQFSKDCPPELYLDDEELNV